MGREQSIFFHIEVQDMFGRLGWQLKEKDLRCQVKSTLVRETKTIEPSPDALRQAELTGSKLDPFKRLAIPI